MLIGTVVAVALGLAPMNESKAPQLVKVDESRIAAQIGHYTQEVREDGKTRIRGFDRLGRAYDLTMDASGHVQGDVGAWYVSFYVKDAA
jgi:hypothetical protein